MTSLIKTARVVAATLALGCGAIVSNASASAQALGVDFDPAIASNFGSSVWNLGWSFTVNSAVAVIGLGNWAGGAAFPQDQQIGLWDSSGNLLASAFVNDSGTAIGQWEFTSIAPVNLVAGETYVVGGEGGADYTGEVGAVTVDPRITYVTDLYTSNAGANSPLVEPTLTENLPYGWFGGNVLLSPVSVPEPASWALMIAGFGFVGGSLRSRRVRVSIA